MASLVSSEALACDPAVDLAASKDRPISIKPDCSFDGAGYDAKHSASSRVMSIGSGGKAFDIGHGRIAQRLSFGRHTCSYEEQLLVVDCRNLEGARFTGVYPVDNELEATGSMPYVANIYLIQPPHGPIALKANTQISELVSLARDGGIDYTTDYDGQAHELTLKNRYDPHCGCNLFYPDSAGAKQ